LIVFSLVYNFHRKTVQAASDIVGIIGKYSFTEVNGDDIMRRVTANEVRTLTEHFPSVEYGSLTLGTAPPKLQRIWNEVSIVHDSGKKESKKKSAKGWIY
jgi:hypothetical protein